MQENLSLLPFYSVARLLEIDFRNLKAFLLEKIDHYRLEIITWAYEKLLRNVSELSKGITVTLEKIREKPKNSDKLVELEKFINRVTKELEKQYKN